MKNKFLAILMLFVFSGLFISYDVQGSVLQDAIQKEETKENKDSKELIDIENKSNDSLNSDEGQDVYTLEYNKYFLELEKLYDLLNEVYDTYINNKNDINNEFLQENLENLKSIISYLDTLDDLDNETKQQIKFLNETEFTNIFEIKNATEKLILLCKNNNIFNDKDCNFKDIEDEELKKNLIEKETNINIEDKSHSNNLNDIYNLVEDESDNSGEESLEIVKLLNNDIAKTQLDDKEVNENNDEKIYKVNISNLEVLKENNKLKIAFKIDNSLDLKNEKNNLKIYIANNSMPNKEILITKDKSLDKYLCLENVTSLSGEILRFGKNDILSEGRYSVVLTEDELEKLNNIGLENLVVKVQVDSYDISNSAIGYLEKDDKEKTNDLKVNKQEEVKVSEVKNTETIKKSLPKTGTIFDNFFSLGIGGLSILTGSLLLKFKKV